MLMPAHTAPFILCIPEPRSEFGTVYNGRKTLLFKCLNSKHFIGNCPKIPLRIIIIDASYRQEYTLDIEYASTSLYIHSPHAQNNLLLYCACIVWSGFQEAFCLLPDVASKRNHKGLSMRSNHYKKRTECLNKFATFYNGYLPLHYTSVRIHRA